MGKLKMSLKLTFCVLVTVFGTASNSIGQETLVASKNVDLARMRLDDLSIEAESIGELFSRFSFTYDIPVGLEVARNDDDLIFYRIDFKKGTLSDLLTQFVTEHKRYSWKIENGVLSVFPKEDYRDPVIRELLITQIGSFSVKAKTSAWDFGEAVLSTPEIRRILELHGMTYDTGPIGGFYIQQLGQQFSFDVSKHTVEVATGQGDKGKSGGPDLDY